MARQTFRQILQPGELEISIAVNGRELTFDAEELDGLNQLVKQFLTLDRTAKTFTDKRETTRQSLIDRVGSKVLEIVHLRRRKRIAIFHNRAIYDVEALRERLGPEHREAFHRCVDEGLTARITLPADEASKREVAHQLAAMATDHGGVAEVYFHLETFVREPELLDYCRRHRINLVGTRTLVTNFVVSDLPRRS